MSHDNNQEKIQVFKIVQANTASFHNLYMHNTLLVLVENGSKCISTHCGKKVSVTPCQALIFTPGHFLTIENRVLPNSAYSALCISYPDSAIRHVFGAAHTSSTNKHNHMVHIERCPKGLHAAMKNLVNDNDPDLPKDILEYKCLEPLVWLKSIGIHLSTKNTAKSHGLSIRSIIAQNPSWNWKCNDLASRLALSEATLRRRLREKGTSFSAILASVRLEHGLNLLQSTNLPVYDIALRCGFSSSSHFSSAFKSRFDIQPRAIRKKTR